MAGFYSCLRGENSDCNIMASGPPDLTANQEPAEAPEDCPGKKKSRFQTFKNFFARKKRKETVAPAGEVGLKASQSSDNVCSTEPSVTLSNTDHESGSKANMGNKAMSHDSVFVSDLPSSEVNEGLVSSQESIHGKVKSLQLQLAQTIRLGSPPALICATKGDDTGALSEDDGLPCSPPEISTLHTVLAGSSHRTSNLVQRSSSLSLEGFDSDDEQMSFEASSSRPVSPLIYHPVDFSQPASSSSCLDSSAARHRIAVKHRACTKRKPVSRELLEGSKLKALSGRLPLRVEENQQSCALEEKSTSEENMHEGFQIQQADADEEAIGVGEQKGMTCEEASLPVPQTIEENSDQDLLNMEEGEEQSSVHDVSHHQDASSTSSSSSASIVADSEPFLQDSLPVLQQPLKTVSPLASSQESLGSLDTPDGQHADYILESNSKAGSEEHGSLLLEVLSSLEHPLTSAFVLEPEAVFLRIEMDETKLESAVECSLPDKQALSPDPQHSLLEEATPLSSETLCVFVGTDEDEHSEEEECMESKECEDNTGREGKYLINVPQHLLCGGLEENEDSVEAETEDLVTTEPCLPRESEEPEEDKDVTVEEEMTSGIQEENIPVELDRGMAEPRFVNEIEELPNCSSVPKRDRIESLGSASQPTIQMVDTPPKHLSEADTSLDQAEPIRPSDGALGKGTDEPSPTTDTGPEQSTEEVPDIQEDSGTRPVTPDQGKFRFTIAPAWQRSLSGGQLSTSVAHGAFEVQTPEMTHIPSRAESVDPVKGESAPTTESTVEALTPLPSGTNAEEESGAENLFGVKLRKTSLRLRYGSEGPGEIPVTSAEQAKASYPEPLNTKPALPRKPELVDDSTPKFKKIPELAGGRSLGGSSASPSWISVAKQKQKIFKENSLEENPERKYPFDKDEPGRKSSLPILTNPTSKAQSSTLSSQVSCSLEISKSASAEKEGKSLSASSPPVPLGQEEPPWLALAKKKAKAWSEMPQIVQ